MNLFNQLIVFFGEFLLVVGVVGDLIGALGMLRFPNFFVRLHAATIGAIGGAFYPLLGVTLIAFGADFLGAYRWFIAGSSLITASLIAILAPTGTHALARATYRSKVSKPYPKVVDHLEEDSRA
jgi:multicomponent Na+:H+ antiporter subunit G